MTMPHLMNCAHSGDSWCLDCVKELWDEKQLQEFKFKETLKKVLGFLDSMLEDQGTSVADMLGDDLADEVEEFMGKGWNGEMTDDSTRRDVQDH